MPVQCMDRFSLWTLLDYFSIFFSQRIFFHEPNDVLSHQVTRVAKFSYKKPGNIYLGFPDNKQLVSAVTAQLFIIAHKQPWTAHKYELA